MTATYTIRTTGYRELEAAAAWVKELPTAAKTALMLAATAARARLHRRAAGGRPGARGLDGRQGRRTEVDGSRGDRQTGGAVRRRALRRTRLPDRLPFVGLGALVWYGYRAARK